MKKINPLWGLAIGALFVLAAGFTMNSAEVWVRGVLKAGTSKVSLTNAAGNLSTTSGTYSGNVAVGGTVAVTGSVTVGNDLTVADDWIATDVAAGVTAATGSAQGDGQISTFATQVATSATNGDAVTLPGAMVGDMRVVCNGAAANSVDVFPLGGDQINKESVDTAIALAAGECAFCVGFSTSRWGCVIGSAN